MKTSKIWDFIGSNIISLLTIMLGLIVVVLSQLKILPDTIIPATLLALLCLLATSELVEGRKKLSKVEEKLDDVANQILQATQGIKTISFQTHEDAILYHAKRILEATLSIDHASIDHRRTQDDTPERKKFENAREKAALSSQIKYRYVSVLHSKRRLDLGHNFIIDKKARNFFAGYFPKPEHEIPLMSFVIIDKKEVITRYPYEHGQDSGYIAIQSPVVVKLFLGYFERLWEDSEKLRDMKDYTDLKKHVESSVKE